MAKKKKKLIVANWKMNPLTLAEAENLFMAIKKGTRGSDSKIVVCPPFVYLNELKHFFIKDRIALGAQDVFWEKNGAFTGEISSQMISTVGGSYAIIGHSERRANGETDEMVSKKVQAALKAGLSVILCVGERVRDDHGEYLAFLKNQLAASLSGVTKKYLSKLTIAYEPVWAIGKGHEAMNAHDLHQIVIFIRKTLLSLYKGSVHTEIPIIYGGSVDAENAESMVHEGEVDGLLIGRESLKPESFSEIVKAVER
jgi:triosephosphate isomerase (TIM)